MNESVKLFEDDIDQKNRKIDVGYSSVDQIVKSVDQRIFKVHDQSLWSVDLLSISNN